MRRSILLTLQLLSWFCSMAQHTIYEETRVPSERSTPAVC